MKHKLLAALLALVMVLSLLPATALAEEAPQPEIADAGYFENGADAMAYFKKILDGKGQDCGSGPIMYIRIKEPWTGKMLISYTIGESTYGTLAEFKENTFQYWTLAKTGDDSQVPYIIENGEWKVIEGEDPVDIPKEDVTASVQLYTMTAFPQDKNPPKTQDLTALEKGAMEVYVDDALHIIDFGYGATKAEADAAARAHNPNVVTTDWGDQTMWVTFNKPILDGETVKLTLKAGETDVLNGDTMDCVGNSTSRTYAWSFLNNKQTPGVGISAAEYTITATKEGQEIDIAETAKTFTVEPAAETPTVKLANLGSGEDHPYDGEPSVAVNPVTSPTGDYYELDFTASNLQMHESSASEGTKYWIGFAVQAPDDCAKFAHRGGKDFASLMAADFKTETSLEPGVTFDGGKGGCAAYIDAKDADAPLWQQIKWISASGETLRIDTFKVVLDKVTYAPEIGEDAATSVAPANVHDTGSDAEDSSLAEGYTIESAEWDPESGVVNVVIDARNVKLHTNPAGIPAYWVGFCVKAPEGAESVTVAQGASREDTAGDGSAVEILDNTYNGTEKGVSFYLNAGNATFKESGRWYKLVWTVDDKQIAVLYHVTLAETVTVTAPDAPEVHAAITADGGEKNDPSEPEVALTTTPDGAKGYYFNVTLSPNKLYKTQKEGSGDSKYFTGFALPAPDGAEKMRVAFVKDGEDLTLTGDPIALESRVYVDSEGVEHDGVAFYVEVAEDLTLDAEWSRVEWRGEDGKILATYTFHILLDKAHTFLQPDTVDNMAILDFGFEADGEAANTVITDSINTNLKPTNDAEITDCVENTMFVVFSGNSVGIPEGKEVTARFTCGEKEYSETVTIMDESRGAVIYFSFNDGAKDVDFGAGEFTVELFVDKLLVDAAKLAIYTVTYDAGEGGQFTEDEPAPFLATLKNAQAAQKPAVTAEGKVLDGWTEAIDENAYTVTYTADWKDLPKPGTVENVAILDFGFEADGETANSVITDSINTNLEPTNDVEITDCVENTMYVVFSGNSVDAPEGKEVTARFTCGEKVYSETVTVMNESRGAVIYFSFIDGAKDVDFGAGEFTVELYVDDVLVDSAKLAIYTVAYSAGENGQFTDGEPAPFLATLENAKTAKKPAVTAAGKVLDGWTEDVDDENFTVTYTAVWKDITIPGPGYTPDPGPAPSVPDHSDTCECLKYADLSPDRWYHEAADFVIAKGWFQGKSDGKFHPGDEASRQQMLLVLARMAQVEGVTDYAGALVWAKTQGISDALRPTAGITRQEIVTMLWRLAGEPASTASYAGFADAASVSHWAVDAMRWAVEKGIILGRDDNTIDPRDNATRIELAAVIYRYVKATEK